MGDMWKLVVPVVGSLIAGALLHVLKEGGVRRMRRRNIREELELLEVLGDHPDPAARIRRRVQVMLEQYEPSEARVASRRKRLEFVLETLIALLGALVVIVVFELESPWAIAAVGLTLGAAANAAELLFERRRDRAEQDQAVLGTVDAVLPMPTSEAHGVVRDPADLSE